MKQLVIAVASHKPYRMPDDPAYLPLRVGAALRPEGVPGMEEFARDDEGDSISEWNPWYSELTGLWWVWKNVDAEYKGLVHYRRHFASPDLRRRLARDRFGRVATGEEVMAALRSSGAPVLLPKRRNYVVSSVGGHYRSTMPGEQMDVARGVLSDLEPAYLPAFDCVLAGRTAHLFNMMVMRADVLDAYCSWLFPVLDEVCRRLDPASYDPFNARYPGRVSERMLDACV